MSRKKKKIVQPLNKVEIINRKTKKIRTIFHDKEEIIIYNNELNQFQLLPPISASYVEDNKLANERER